MREDQRKALLNAITRLSDACASADLLIVESGITGIGTITEKIHRLSEELRAEVESQPGIDVEAKLRTE